jgi:hypothetical protein
MAKAKVESKFIQVIATSAHSVNSGKIETTILSLDENGNVWRFDPAVSRQSAAQWVPLPMARGVETT